MRITREMVAAGRAQLERHSMDTGGTYEVTCTADTLVRDIFKAMTSVDMNHRDKSSPAKAHG